MDGERIADGNADGGIEFTDVQTGEGNGTGQTAESKCQKNDSFPKQEYGKSDTDTACCVAHS
jgi:hypothetical protein